eukprot:c3628_g1_i2.p2 GENE.c3628_g1_i2~~c3628_g1_i2.p2  ORF type:complete len:200 (+),score=50.58 c3628_g1_i2:100-699(+)
MGARSSKLRAKLKQKEIDELASRTHFTGEELTSLYEHFKHLSATHDNDGVIDQKEFMEALELRDSAFSARIFGAFDHNGDGMINFREFVSGLSVFSSRSTVDEKLALSFQIYDIDGDGFIDKDELFQILKASLLENYMLDMSEEHMRSLIDQTFLEADKNSDGRISFDEYTAMVRAHPNILANFSVNADLLMSSPAGGS